MKSVYLTFNLMIKLNNLIKIKMFQFRPEDPVIRSEAIFEVLIKIEI